MAVQIVMDHTGDTRHHFDPADARAIAEAEARFMELTGTGLARSSRALTRPPRRHCSSRGFRAANRCRHCWLGSEDHALGSRTWRRFSEWLDPKSDRNTC